MSIAYPASAGEDFFAAVSFSKLKHFAPGQMSNASSSSCSSSDEADLDSSELGTHEYWQTQYAKELQNLREHDDEGEIWYSRPPKPPTSIVPA